MSHITAHRDLTTVPLSEYTRQELYSKLHILRDHRSDLMKEVRETESDIDAIVSEIQTRYLAVC